MNDKLDSSAPAAGHGAPAGNWERDVLEKLVFATLQEQRAHRRWSIFFKVFGLLIVLFALWVFYDYNTADDSETLGRHTALIDISGAIESEGSGSAAVVIPALDKAFSDSGSVAVVLHINSPGGSPVQAGMIVDEMQRLARAIRTSLCMWWSMKCAPRAAITSPPPPIASMSTRPAWSAPSAC